MNILFLTSTLPRFQNDSQPSFVIEQAKAWKKQRSLDDIYILAPADAHAQREETIDNILIRRYSYFFPSCLQRLAYPAILPNIKKNPILILQIPFLICFQFISTLRLCKKYQINLIYAHWIMPQGIIAFAIHHFLKIPYVLQNHSSDLKIFSKIPFGQKLARKILKNAEHIFTVNSQLKKEALKIINGKDEYLQNKLTVLPMGITLQNSTNNLVYDFGIIARLSKKKGVDLFFKAASEIKELFPNMKIVIAGEGEEGKNLKSLARTLGLNVDFKGFVTGREKSDLISQAKTFLFPSITTGSDREGLPVALLEILSAGKSIIASKDTNIKLLPEWDKIRHHITILNDPSDIKDFSKCLRKHLTENFDVQNKEVMAIIKRYNWDCLIQEYFHALALSPDR